MVQAADYDARSGVPIAPPPARDEAVPRPRSRHVWIPGYWDWMNGKYLWAVGRWVPARRGYHWQRHLWALREGSWHSQIGAWACD